MSAASSTATSGPTTSCSRAMPRDSRPTRRRPGHRHVPQAGRGRAPAQHDRRGHRHRHAVYMAPEQAVADPTVNYSADLYRSGRWRTRCWWARRRSAAGQAAAVLAAHAGRRRRRSSGAATTCPASWCHWSCSAWRRSRSDGAKSGSHLVRALDDSAISGGRPATSARSRRRSLRRWAWVVVALGLVLLAAWWRTAHRPGATATPAAAAPAALRPAGGSVAVQVRPTLPDDARAGGGRPLARVGAHHGAEPGARVPDRLASGRGGAAAARRRLRPGRYGPKRERTRIRVNLRFVDATRDSTMWAMQVVRYDSLFALEDTLSRAAAGALRGTGGR